LFFYQMNIGTIGIEEKDSHICRVYFQGEKWPQGIGIYESALLKEAADQLKRYLTGELKSFSLPFRLDGTPFMKEVWQWLCKIPYGETRTYKQVAEQIGRPKAARAVGLACNRNPLPIFIPCHRVIGSNGTLTGYRGGIDMKERLLCLEANQ
jgi:methylated-DNA-[protein]-cysteine S-methyltransferase